MIASSVLPHRGGRLLICPNAADMKLLCAGDVSGEAEKAAAVFGQPGVADAYQHRPPYPDEVFDLLERLIADLPRTVLDIGAGEGALARPLASRVDHVDAVDASAAMSRRDAAGPEAGGGTCAGSSAPPRPRTSVGRMRW